MRLEVRQHGEDLYCLFVQESEVFAVTDEGRTFCFLDFSEANDMANAFNEHMRMLELDEKRHDVEQEMYKDIPLHQMVVKFKEMQKERNV